MAEMAPLYMELTGLDTLPPLHLPEGVTLRTHIPGQELQWEALIEAAFGMKLSFEGILVPFAPYEPEHILYICENGQDMATAMGTENPRFPGKGWIRLVGTLPESKGKGYGKLAVLAALHDLKARGYKNVLLQTEDFRLPAISLYRKLGFQPLMTDPSHGKRWETIEKTLTNK